MKKKVEEIFQNKTKSQSDEKYKKNLRKQDNHSRVGVSNYGMANVFL